MRFRHAFHVDAPVEAVRQLYSGPAGLRAITPPIVPMTRVRSPEVLGEGSRMSFTLWLGPVPVRWVARIRDVDALGFTDVQESGPFAHWHHRHEFLAQADGSTLVTDRVTARLARDPLQALVGWKMFVGLPLLFAYRTWATRRRLEP
jgi:ligand-binding SRPBCC domain-containing protein